ncbi:hypothetical protein ACTJKJ_20275 [Roseateles sp. 22389]|uniref:hypothetical protein n=1 Tax=Roseateles sp. 22389 TaxID=3453916 RepID=UPI003F8462C2
MLGHAVDDVKCIVWINKCVGRKDVSAGVKRERQAGTRVGGSQNANGASELDNEWVKDSA